MRGPDAGDRRLKYLASIAPAFQRIVKRSVELFVCTHNTEMQKQAKNAQDCCPDVLLCQLKRISGCICRFERVPRL
jgi:hypothetical protein